MDDKQQPMKFWSFCKVGGGISSSDLRQILHLTDGKWHDWDPKRLPNEYMDIGHPKELPDVWIKPSDSIVIEVKGTQLITSNEFRTTQTLRFPRFKGLRSDKTWEDSMSYKEFGSIRKEVNKIDEKNSERPKRKAAVKRTKVTLLEDSIGKVSLANVALKDDVFHKQPFYVVDDVTTPDFISKRDLEVLIKENGGTITQSSSTPDVLVVADRDLPTVVGVKKAKSADVIKAHWILESVKKKRELPFDLSDFYYCREQTIATISANSDEYGDSYIREITVNQLKQVMEDIPLITNSSVDDVELRDLLIDLIDIGSGPFKGLLFPRYHFYFDRPSLAMQNGLAQAQTDKKHIEDDFDFVQTYAEFNGATVKPSLHDISLTHIIVNVEDKNRIAAIRALMMARPKMVHIVDISWIQQSWEEGTTLAVDKFVVNK
ncbi:DNA ligase (ATP) DNL4 [Sugiyamaella lignohabitans]|uniref:DNA ligase (ATP) DNL4 n=1 Tax=Sugiyamaella lignohabitans TaxID=796027 RepID=A0A161HIE9_9ASCO|nr:DNA ligase (ATP) DNL4 [Sugiyamaella lignohabitans]ANB12257.1 DNA ligase (ATP) DNL4 [Sugiyamaella lignohabitans]